MEVSVVMGDACCTIGGNTGIWVDVVEPINLMNPAVVLCVVKDILGVVFHGLADQRLGTRKVLSFENQVVVAVAEAKVVRTIPATLLQPI